MRCTESCLVRSPCMTTYEYEYRRCQRCLASCWAGVGAVGVGGPPSSPCQSTASIDPSTEPSAARSAGLNAARDFMRQRDLCRAGSCWHSCFVRICVAMPARAEAWDLFRIDAMANLGFAHHRQPGLEVLIEGPVKLDFLGGRPDPPSVSRPAPMGQNPVDGATLRTRPPCLPMLAPLSHPPSLAWEAHVTRQTWPLSTLRVPSRS